MVEALINHQSLSFEQKILFSFFTSTSSLPKTSDQVIRQDIEKRIDEDLERAMAEDEINDPLRNK